MYLEEMHKGTYYKIRDRKRADPASSFDLEGGTPRLLVLHGIVHAAERPDLETKWRYL